MQVVSIAALVGDHHPGSEAFDQLASLDHVLLLSRPEQQAHRVTERIGGSVDFGAHTPGVMP